MEELDYTISQHRLQLRGVLTRATIPTIWKRWQKDIATQQVEAVDVSAVSNVDTAGVALLLELVKRQQRSSIQCVGANEQMKQIAAVSGVKDVLSLS